MTITRREAQEIAFSKARGDYQRNVVENDAWSGSELRGSARDWSSRYRASREALIDRIADAIPDAFVLGYGRNGRKVAIYGTCYVRTYLEAVSAGLEGGDLRDVVQRCADGRPLTKRLRSLIA